jgi:hypothetical protein
MGLNGVRINMAGCGKWGTSTAAGMRTVMRGVQSNGQAKLADSYHEAAIGEEWGGGVSEGKASRTCLYVFKQGFEGIDWTKASTRDCRDRDEDLSFTILVRFRASDLKECSSLHKRNISFEEGMRGVKQGGGFGDKVVRSEETPEPNQEASPNGTVAVGTIFEMFPKAEKYGRGEREFWLRSVRSCAADSSE